MKQPAFETMAARLMNVLPGINAPAKVVRAAKDLLNCENIALLRYQCDLSAGAELETREVVATKEREPWTEQTYINLRRLFPRTPTSTDHGYTEHVEVHGDQVVRSERPSSTSRQAFVAFSSFPELLSTRYELVAIHAQSPSEWFSTYHTWAARMLVREFERAQVQELARQMALAEERAKRLAAYTTGKVLRHEPWRDIEDRSSGSDDHQLLRMGAIWTAYRVRDEYAGQRREPAPERLRQAAATQLAQPALLDHDQERLRLPARVIELLHADPHAGDEAAAAAWIRNLSQLGSEIRSRTDVTLTPEELQLLTLALEHGWRTLRDASLGLRRPPPTVTPHDAGETRRTELERHGQCCRELLALTCHVARQVLVAPPTESPLGGITVERGTLRLYFALLVGSASRLKRLYLPDPHDLPTSPAAPEMTRQFALNLSRYMLCVVRVLEERSDLDTTRWPVSEVEALDALLYMIDRYACIELEVDDRLPVRELLKRALAAEIRLHLNSSRYRDHLTHVLDVFLLGHMLLGTHFRPNGKMEDAWSHHLATGNGSVPSTTLYRNWAVAALLHDVGYQLPGAKRAADNPRDWSEYFSLDARSSRHGLDARACSAPDWSPEGFLSKLRAAVDPESATLPDPKLHPHDHGVLSALRIGQLLLDAGVQEEPAAVARQAELLAGYTHALHAMAHHNLFSYPVELKTRPLACLLRLCDELQEWGRRRINVERMVKHLYLNIDGEDESALPGRTSLEALDTNLVIERSDDSPIKLKIRTTEGDPHFRFSMRFRNPADAGVDALTTVLSKAYNLQSIRLEQAAGAEGMRWSLELRFPRPREYGELTEYDLYALYVDRPRPLPLLPSYGSLAENLGGLSRITPPDGRREDCFAIVVGTNYATGRIKVDPSNYFEELVRFKEDLLRQQSSGRDVGR